MQNTKQMFYSPWTAMQSTKHMLYSQPNNNEEHKITTQLICLQTHQKQCGKNKWFRTGLINPKWRREP
jgi:hypothetical protein